MKRCIVAKRGRKTQLTPEVYNQIIDAVANGNFRAPAAKASGISERTLRLWIKSGRESTSGLYHNFYMDLLKAENTAELKQVKLILDAAVNDPRHAQWWLERKFPARWGKERDVLRQLLDTVKRLEAERVNIPKVTETSQEAS